MLFYLDFFCYWIQIGLILYASIKETSCKITCVLKRNYWKMLPPCLYLHQGEGQKNLFSGTKIAQDQNKNQLQLSNWPTLSKLSKRLATQAKPALLSDGQRYCLEGTEMLSSCSQLSLAEAACAVGCTTDGKLVSFQFIVVAAMETYFAWTSSTYKPEVLEPCS